MTRLLMNSLQVLLLAWLALAFAPSAHAAESYDNCTGFITSIPAAINSQGTWCLKQDLATGITSGIAISVNTNNVTIDCNGFKLGGLAAGLATTAFGISAGSHSNIVIRHCNVRGFFYGILLNGIGGGHVIEDNRFDGNTFSAISVVGDGSVIRRNRIFDTGQGTTGANHAYGIYAEDTIDVQDNTVSNVVATATSDGDAYAISLFNNVDGSIEGNRVRGVMPDGTGKGWGVYTPTSTRLSLSNNEVIGDGVSSVTGFECNGSGDRARNNVLNGLSTAMNSCGDAGGNDITP